jgi:hypothetical protein
MMKIQFTIIIMYVLSISACARKTAITQSVVGFWKGKASTVSIANNYPISYLLRGDGTVRYFLGADSTNATKFEGVYSVSDRQLKMQYSPISSSTQFKTYSEKCILNEAFTHFDGTWGDFSNTSGGGLTSADKQ